MNDKEKRTGKSGITIENDKMIWKVMTGIAIVFVILLYFFAQKYTENFRDTLWEETQSYMSEIADQVVLVMNDRVESNIKNLETDAVAITRMGAEDPQTLVAFLKEEAERYGYSGLSLAGTEGFATDQDSRRYNVSTRKHYLEALQGRTAVSGLMASDYTNKDCIEFAVPVRDINQVRGVLLANYSLADFQDIFDVNIFNGTGSAMVIDTQGVVIVGNEMSSTYNLFSYLKSDTSISEAVYQKFKGDIAVGEIGSINYSDQNTDHLLHYQPLGINDWYLLISTPTSQISGKTALMLEGMVYIGVAVALLVSFLLMLVIGIQRRNRHRLEHILYVDPVTNGMSFARFEQRAQTLVMERKQPYALILMNIEKFKLVNTTFSWEQGNELLRYIYQSILSLLEEDELVTRVTADRFCILVRYHSKEDLLMRMDTFTKRMNQFNDSREDKYFLDFSGGACIVDGQNPDINMCYERANFSRTHGVMKKYTYGSVAFYSEVEQDVILKEKKLENQMEDALRHGEFKMYLQPKYELRGDTISGAEALVRWIVPGEGMRNPGEFIPLFERNGFIVRLDLYMFDQVCQFQQGRWDVHKRCVPISVNLSRRHLENPDFLQAYREVFANYTFPADLLEIELTESIVFDHMEQLNTIIAELHDIGFTCSMDDFGSGYSSLNMLKEISVDTLKLDRAFFYSSSGDMEKSHFVIENIIDLAGKLKMTTVSEGIETEDQVEYLRSAGCDMVQGFVFAKPQPADQFEKLMEEEEHEKNA